MSFLTKNLFTVVQAITKGSTTTVTTSSNAELQEGDIVVISHALFGDVYQEISGTITNIVSPTEFEIDYNSSAIVGNYVANTGYVAKDLYTRQNYIAVDLVELHLPDVNGASDAVYLSAGGYDLTWDSPTAPDAGDNVYIAQGQFMGFSEVTKDFDVRVGKFSIYLSGVGTDFAGKFAGVSGNQKINYEGSRVCIYKAFLEFQVVNGIQQLVVVPNPLLMFDGIIYNVGITEGSRSCQITIDCSTIFADFERTAGRKTNNGSNHLYQGSTYDTSFEKAGYVASSEIRWGKKA